MSPFEEPREPALKPTGYLSTSEEVCVHTRSAIAYKRPGMGVV